MTRKVKKIVEGEDKVDGAGVQLVRVVGKPDTEDFDPFLMLDAFDNDDPETFTKGFPWHTHRGIETVTYLLKGEIQHRDSLGNEGVIRDGGCQWMTAGSGIIHQEMPQPTSKMQGVQLWVNLPADLKMTEPRYRDFSALEIPQVEDEASTVRVVAGEYKGKKGPMEKITVQPAFMDVTVRPGGTFSLETDPDDTVFIYIITGTAFPETGAGETLTSRQAVLFDRGDKLQVKAGEETLQFLLFSGKPLNEPIAWSGPIVMNTRRELQHAFREIDQKTFIKEHDSSGAITGSRKNGQVYRD